MELLYSPSSLHSSGGFAFLASLGSSHDVVLVLWLWRKDRESVRGSVIDGEREETWHKEREGGWWILNSARESFQRGKMRLPWVPASKKGDKRDEKCFRLTKWQSILLICSLSFISGQGRRRGEGIGMDRGVTGGVMERNSCGLGRFSQSPRQRAGSRSDMMMCQGSAMHLRGFSEALDPQWPPFMMTEQ